MINYKVLHCRKKANESLECLGQNTQMIDLFKTINVDNILLSILWDEC